MKFNDIPLPRRIFRGTLLVILGASMVFFATVVGLRIIYRDAGIEGQLQTTMFEADILQHRALAYFGDDKEDMQIINQLFRLSIFSGLYYQEGVRMLEEKADEGYQPAIDHLALLQNPPVQAP